MTAAIAGSLALAGCSVFTDPDPVICTAHLEPGIVVEIRDAQTGAALAYGARGAVHEGTFVDSLMPAESSSSDLRDLISRAAAHERPGTYMVEVVHDGYQPWRASAVRVEEGVCHVRQVRLQARLERQAP